MSKECSALIHRSILYSFRWQVANIRRQFTQACRTGALWLSTV